MMGGAGVPLEHAWGEPLPSELSAEAARAVARHGGLLDLIGTNPQLCGFEFPIHTLRSIAADAAAHSRIYAPDSRGNGDARAAIAERHGRISPARVILTPGTSFGYWAAFRLLAQPGANMLCPRPTYPLFDDLAQVAGMEVRSYHMKPAGNRHAIDPEEVRFQITPRTVAIVVVSPHNPTGSVAGEEELAALAGIAREHNLAIIFDEVFRSFTHGDALRVPRPADHGAPLAITLNGVSKSLFLPQVKGAWMVVEGTDTARRDRFLSAAEYLADTFLPVSEWVQSALAPLLEAGDALVPVWKTRLTERMREIIAGLRAQGFDTAPPQAGPYLVLRHPSLQDGTPTARQLLRDQGVMLHPGEFYGLERNTLVATGWQPAPWPEMRVDF